MSGSHTHFPVAKEAIPAILQKHGIQVTAQRVEIAAILLAEKQHLSADQVLSRVNGDSKAVSKATVYNTLACSPSAAWCIRYWLIPPKSSTTRTPRRTIISIMWMTAPWSTLKPIWCP